MSEVLESSIEKSVVKIAESFGVLSLKLNLKGSSGWPDRLFLIPGGKPIFIEFKRPGAAPRKLQQYRHQILRKLGYEVQVHDNSEEAVKGLRLSRL